MRVDLVDRGRRTTPRDTIRPLAEALAAAGHSVRLFSTEPPVGGPSRYETIRLNVKGGDDGRNRAAHGKAIGTLLDPSATATVLPFEDAGLKGAPSAGILSVLPPIDAVPIERGSGGWLDRFFGRRAARREEALALSRSRFVIAPGDVERERFLAAAPEAAARTPVIPPMVPTLPELPDRAAARRLLHLPDDVPVAAYLGPASDAASISRTREAFQRARVFFPGSRLLLPGISAPSEPGAHAFPEADGATRLAAARAADLLLAPTLSDPSELLSYARNGTPIVVGAAVRFPVEPPAGALRRSASDDSGALASDLAELFADPALRRRIGEAGRSYADTFAPERVARLFERLVGP